MKKHISISIGLILLICIIITSLVSCGHEHQWGEWQTSKAPTCTEDGYNSRMCATCGETQTTTISATGHSFGEWKTEKVGTCVTPGIDAQYCTSCNYKNTKNIYKDHLLDSKSICRICKKQFINMTDSEKTTALQVHYISNRNVAYDQNNDWFMLTFALKDADEYKLNAPTLVDIRIENDNAVVVYEKTILVKTSDYKNNLATVYIKSSDIKGDYDKSGDLYYKVYNPGYFSFDEFSLSVYNLPLKAATLLTPSTPSTYHYYSYNGSVSSSVKITNIRYEMRDYDMKIYLTGEKTYDKNGSSYSSSCKVGYKIYDYDGYVVKSGTFYSDSIKVGDKFKDGYFWVSDLEIGKTYTLELLNVS